VNTTRVAAVSLLSAAALFGIAPAASAVEGGVVAVSPSTAQPGQTVRITATGCITPNANAQARAYSDAFATASLSPVSGGAAGEVSGTAQVFAGAKPGTYTVNVACDYANSSATSTGTLTVGTMPNGGAHAGLGGSVKNGDSAEVAGGAALLAAGMAAGGFALLRRRQATAKG
jgi:hypothetical protein